MSQIRKSGGLTSTHWKFLPHRLNVVHPMIIQLQDMAASVFLLHDVFSKRKVWQPVWELTEHSYCHTGFEKKN